MKVSIADLTSKVLATLQQGFSKEDSQRIAEVLIWADMCGNATQGVIKLSGTEPLQNVIPSQELKIEKETPVSLLIDACSNPAPLVAQIATDHLIEKASQTGIAIVGVHNLHSSTGAQAFYANRVAEAGLIGIVQSSPTGSTAAFGSKEQLFGTNPIAFSFPTLDAPLSFDMTTSAMTWYGLVLAEAQGRKIPYGVAIDESGSITDNPTEAMNGALIPFGGHKGAGLALVVEVLAGILPGADYCSLSGGSWGSTFIAIDPEILVGREEFKTRCSDMVSKVRVSKRLPGIDEVRLPGERSAAAYETAKESGFVEVDDSILRNLGYY